MKAVRVPRGTYFKHAVGTTGLDERQRGAIMSYNASLTQCPQRSCGNYLEDGHVGAHVQIEGHSGMWIIPTCKDCNTEAKNIADVNVYNTNEWVSCRLAVRFGILSRRWSQSWQDPGPSAVRR